MWSIKKPSPIDRHFSAGSYLFREGEISHSLYLIKSGSVAVRKRKADGEIEIARVHSNEVLGEVSFFDRQPRSASAIALTEVEVHEITFEALEKVFEKVPPYFKTIMASVAERLRRADDIIKKLDKDIIYESTQTTAKDEGFTAADALAALDPDKTD